MIEIVEKLKKEISNGLPGIDSHRKLAPEGRDLLITEGEKINAAVLILLYKNEANQLSTVFIKRQVYSGHHSAQISFPGGKEELPDGSLENTALRESEEEIGIVSNDISVIGKLTELYIPVSNFLVHPYIGFCNYTPDFCIDTSEVEYLITASISSIVDQTILTTNMDYKGDSYEVPYFSINNEMVWGATAMILNEFIELFKKVELTF